MDQFWEIVNSPVITVAWKALWIFATLGYLAAAGVGIWLLKKHLMQNEKMLAAISASQSDIRLLMESKQDHTQRIHRLEDNVMQGNNRRRT